MSDLVSRLPTMAPGKVDRMLVRLVGVMGGIAIASWVFVAAAGLSTPDPPHVPGVWMGLAAHANAGVLYPPFYDGSYYGGTRYMPLFFLAHAALARVTGDYLISGHLLVMLCTGGLLATLLHGMVRAECGIDAAVALTGTVLVTAAGLLVTTTIRGDVLPAALQLAAIQAASAAAPAGRRRLGLAAVLCTLAFFAKVSALWGVLAIGTDLAMRRSWRQFVWFLSAYAGGLILLVLVLQSASEGRFLTNMHALTFTGSDPQRMGLAAAGTALGFLFESASPVWALMGLALGGLVMALTSRQLGIPHLAFVFAALITLVVISDPGTGANQLIDIVALSLLLIGHAWSLARAEHPAAGLPVLMAATVLWILGSAYLLVLRPQVRQAWRMVSGAAATVGVEQFRGRFASGARLLSEDPAVPVMLGQLPAVLDPWTLLRLGQHGRTRLEPLIARVEAQEFDAVLLLYDHTDPSAPWWYELQHFGRPVVDAIGEAYERVGRIDGLHVYVPRGQRSVDDH